MSVQREIGPTDSCGRCGLRRATRELEQKGVYVQLCDDCFWGSEPPAEAKAEDKHSA